MRKNDSRYLAQQDIWYRNPMVWFAIGLPAFVVAASIVTIVIAVNNAPIMIERSSALVVVSTEQIA